MKKRVLSAIVMLIVFIPTLLIGGVYYPILGSILGLIALWELMNLEKNIPNYMKYISYFICLFLILYNYNDRYYLEMYNYGIIAGVFFLYSISLIIKNDLKKYTYKEAIFLFSSVFIIGLLFNGFIRVRLLNINYTIYCFIISIMTDTFAYIGGNLIGKRKLAPAISPNKTISGAIVGSIFGTLCSGAFFYFVISNNIIVALLLSLSLTIVSQMGDLFFSSIKRSYHIKDFSNLIPGHGGVLDRLDSVLFVILGFLVYIII